MLLPSFQCAPTDASFRRKRPSHGVEEVVVAALRRDGFDELNVPLVDRAAPYDGVLPDELLRRTYRFTDRDGELLLLRSDFTPFVARALAPSAVESTAQLRAFYRGEVVRAERSGAPGATLRQVGAEVVGGEAATVDTELLRLVAQVCDELQLRCALVLSDSSLVDELVAAAGNAQQRERLRNTLASKRRDSAAEFRQLLPAALAAIAAGYVRGTLTLDQLLECSATRAAGSRLRGLVAELESLSSLSVETFLTLDSVERERGYYTGFRFELIAAGESRPIAAGGRYDALYGRFGADSPAAGFTFDVAALERLS
jgi:ATP phosphoribosyltransferase regulatory subunit